MGILDFSIFSIVIKARTGAHILRNGAPAKKDARDRDRNGRWSLKCARIYDNGANPVNGGASRNRVNEPRPSNWSGTYRCYGGPPRWFITRRATREFSRAGSNPRYAVSVSLSWVRQQNCASTHRLSRICYYPTSCVRQHSYWTYDGSIIIISDPNNKRSKSTKKRRAMSRTSARIMSGNRIT